MPALGADSLLSLCQVPIIDLGHMDVGCYQRSCVKRVATQMHKSLADKGIAMLVNHGIPEQKLREVYKYMNKFCCLSEKHKEDFLNQHAQNTQYISPEHHNFGSSIEDKHTFVFTHVDTNDNTQREPTASPPPCDHLPEFQQTISQVSEEFCKISKLLLQALAISIDLNPSHFLQTHENILKEDNESNLSLVYYPSYQCVSDEEAAAPLPAIDVGLVDEGTFTLTVQDSECGIEILSPTTNKWQRVGHLPGAILINTGKLLELWTSGAYKALKHRIIIPESTPLTPHSQQGRYYLSLNVHPDLNTPLDCLYSEQAKPQAQEVPDQQEGSKTHKTLKQSWQATCQEVTKRLRHTKYFWKTIDVRIQT
uniref:Gibberellin 20 oxidase 3 n=1 Tax=Cacopsylla melanoneura TaxID=428564 RepID=A0A8D8VW84_9HEMI